MAQTALVGAQVLVGPFLPSYKAPGAGSFTSLGVIDAKGVRVIFQPNIETFDCDQYGEGTAINGVYKGGNMFVEFTLREANLAQVANIAYPFNETSPGYGLDREIGVIGA